MEIDAPPVENFWLRHCQNVLKTFEMAIRRAGDTNGIRERFLSLDLFLLTFKNYFIFWPFFEGGGGDRPHPPSPPSATGRSLRSTCSISLLSVMLS